MAALKALAVPEDSPLKNASNLVLSFPSTPSQSEDEAEFEEEAEAEKMEEAVGAKSPTLNDQVLDLTQDEEDEVSKGAFSQKTTSEVPIAEKSIDQTLQEIDAELEAEKVADKFSQLSSRGETQSAANAE
ncbi:hypothetical protein CsSME_00006597 [Camellia sinensis var. sinensis]